jgi:putative ABC transport system ATP-binding protein
MPYLTVLENVLLPYMNTLKGARREHSRRAIECLEKVGLEGKVRSLPGRLSGGEQQRVAIARALVKLPSILFADEPTGNLDRKTGESIMKLLRGLNRDGLTVVMVTHEPAYTRFADRILEIDDGAIEQTRIVQADPPERPGALPEAAHQHL